MNDPHVLRNRDLAEGLKPLRDAIRADQEAEAELRAKIQAEADALARENAARIAAVARAARRG